MELLVIRPRCGVADLPGEIANRRGDDSACLIRDQDGQLGPSDLMALPA